MNSADTTNEMWRAFEQVQARITAMVGPEEVTCPDCNGTTDDPRDDRFECPWCRGKGTVRR